MELPLPCNSIYGKFVLELKLVQLLMQDNSRSFCLLYYTLIVTNNALINGDKSSLSFIYVSPISSFLSIECSGFFSFFSCLWPSLFFCIFYLSYFLVFIAQFLCTSSNCPSSSQFSFLVVGFFLSPIFLLLPFSLLVVVVNVTF